MSGRQSPDSPRACCGIGVGWKWFLWVLLGAVGVATLAALPSILEAALSNAGLF